MISLGKYADVTEVQGPRAYQVRSGSRWLDALEDGAVRSWPEYHLILIDERTGLLTIEGGYGTFSYGWPSVARGSESLHAFLYDLHFDYFMGKAAKQPHRVYDHDRTIAELRRRLIELRREGWHSGLTKQGFRDAWDDIGQIDACGCSSEGEFYRYAETYGGTAFMALFWVDGPPEAYEREHAGMRRFWDEVWRPFCEQQLRQHWLAHIARTPIPRRRALVAA